MGAVSLHIKLRFSSYIPVRQDKLLGIIAWRYQLPLRLLLVLFILRRMGVTSDAIYVLQYYF